MTAPAPGDGGQAPTTQPTATPPANEPPAGQAPAGSQTDGSTGTGSQQTFPATYVQQLRQEAANARTQNAALAAQVSTLQADVQKYEAFMPQQVAELTSRIETVVQSAADAAERERQANINYQVAVGAQQVGIVDPEAAVALLNKSAIEWDGNEPKNISALLTALLETKPYLKAQTSTPLVPPVVGPTNPASPGRPPEALTLADVRRMKAFEINAQWDAVQAALKAGR